MCNRLLTPGSAAAQQGTIPVALRTGIAMEKSGQFATLIVKMCARLTKSVTFTTCNQEDLPMRLQTRALGLLAASAALVSACSSNESVTPSSADGEPMALALTSGSSAGTPRFLVQLAEGTPFGPGSAIAAVGTVLDVMPAINAIEVQSSNVDALRATAGVKVVEPSFEFLIETRQGDGIVPQGGAQPQNALPVGINQSSAPFFASGIQWDKRAIRVNEVWSTTNGGQGTKACVIDSGIDPTHQETDGMIANDTSFFSNSPTARDSNGHGTHVATTIAAKGVAMASVAPNARLMTAKVFSATGGTPVARVVNAITWCTDRGAHVINMSLGGIRYYQPVSGGNDFINYNAAVQYARNAGVVVVASAGNSNIRLQPLVGRTLVLPAQIPGIVTVGATGPLSRVGLWPVDGQNRTLPLTVLSQPVKWDPTMASQVWFGPDGKAFYSNFGDGVTVFAPGGRGSVPAGYVNRIMTDAAGARVQQVGSAYDNIIAACSRWATYTGWQNVGGDIGASQVCRSATTATTARYAILAGTSMAAPQVSGLAAILYGELGGVRSTANRAKVEQCLRATDNVGPSSTFGGGRINAVKAVACVRS
ncbi:MAG: S8 family serine peptidase [Gemmatimonadales bacterium]|nr:S8 family serine peptidase [Gemmatimonadales bacterium]